jgi:predicted N-acetyltransferase YhbS
MNTLTRPKTSADYKTIRRVHRLAFGQDEEANLGDALDAVEADDDNVRSKANAGQELVRLHTAVQ